MTPEDLDNWETRNGRLVGRRCRMRGFDVEILAVPNFPAEKRQLIGFVVAGGLEDERNVFSLSWDADSFELVDETQEVKKSGRFALSEEDGAKLSSLLDRLREQQPAEVEITQASRLLDENLDIATLTQEDLDALYAELQALRPVDDEIMAELSQLLARPSDLVMRELTDTYHGCDTHQKLREQAGELAKVFGPTADKADTFRERPSTVAQPADRIARHLGGQIPGGWRIGQKVWFTPPPSVGAKRIIPTLPGRAVGTIVTYDAAINLIAIECEGEIYTQQHTVALGGISGYYPDAATENPE
jgi:hypothetical protein